MASVNGVAVPIPLPAGAEYPLGEGERLLPLDGPSQRFMAKMAGNTLPVLWEASRKLFSAP